jgi:hypothetical protein
LADLFGVPVAVLAATLMTAAGVPCLHASVDTAAAAAAAALHVKLQPAFPAELGDNLGQQLIEAWGFMACLADLFGAPPFSMEALLGGLLQGASSPLLGLVHVLLLRQAQADMEEAHATGVLQVSGRLCGFAKRERPRVGCAQELVSTVGTVVSTVGQERQGRGWQ